MEAILAYEGQKVVYANADCILIAYFKYYIVIDIISPIVTLARGRRKDALRLNES
jgi:hypothetical protein